MGQPSDRVTLAAARRVLDQVALARPMCFGVGQQPEHYVELVITRPDLVPFLPPRLRIFRLHHLGVVLQDVGQARARQYFAPQVVGLDPIRLGGFPAPSFTPG